MSDTENPPAFGSYHYRGMTLRDYFAGQALAGCMAKHNKSVITARALYEIADAMLAERAKGGGA